MSDIIQQYLKDSSKDAFDYFIEIKKRFMGSTSNKKKNGHICEFEELKQTQDEFHEYVWIMMKAIAESIKPLKRIKKGHKYHKQSEDIRQELKSIGRNILETEKNINYYTNVLLDLISFGSNKKGVLSKKEINSLKNDNIPLLQLVFQPESDYALELPQEPLFSLIGFFISLCRSTMRLCLIQQQIQDICFEAEFDLPTRKELLFVKNMINEKMSEIKEEIHMSNRRIDEMSTSQIELNSKQEDNSKKIQQEIKNRNKAEKTKPIKSIICLKVIETVLKDAKLEIHFPSIKKRISSWNTFIRTDGKKGAAPLAGYEYARLQTPSFFKDWVLTTFLPDYRARLRKKGDALNDAIHGLF